DVPGRGGRRCREQQHMVGSACVAVKQLSKRYKIVRFSVTNCSTPGYDISPTSSGFVYCRVLKLTKSLVPHVKQHRYA
ncbi:MAG: hypothetical protein ACN6RA_00960, partial [Stenotrophomonas maltophilia]